MTVRALVLSDTHIRRGGSRPLPSEVLAAAAAADLILHAGDVVTADVLERLGELAPVHAVLGNNDHELVGHLAPTLRLDVGGLAVALVHDSGPAEGRAARLARMFPDAGLVVFGHSHTPQDGAGAGGQWLLNPGSSTERRRAPTHTFAWLEVEPGAGFSTSIVHLGA
jgi:putative phosphoesterase